MSQLLVPFKDASNTEFESTWESPSNIALVKYWGKKAHQLPSNPSLSMSLSKCTTTTKTKISPDSEFSVALSFEGRPAADFSSKIEKYLLSLKDELPWITGLRFEIETHNTFPHGAGIASSASGMSALALTLADYLKHLRNDEDESLFFKRASYLSRLASGSACRSVFGGFSFWGESELTGSTDKYATSLKVHSAFNTLHDTILVIDSSVKEVSSRMGHERMKGHYFSESRITQARDNFTKCAAALADGDIDLLGSVIESEALSLHAMMLTSPEPYILMKGNTLTAIEAIWTFRKDTKLPLFFTLDAGPNLHLIYPDSFKDQIQSFIKEALSALCESIIFDQVGKGPRKC